MENAYSYKRVSSQEQKEKKNSIPEQENRINKFAKEKNIQITRKFEDSNSAFHDNNRSDFDRMIELALIEKPNYIILDDSSRFARTRQVAIDAKATLRSYGINILYASEPNIDVNTVSGFWLEGIQEIKNEATSREIAFHVKKGMSGNLNQRDIETGWCYKNGGKAPFGYKRTILYRGMNSRGKPIYKTIWELDENTSNIVRKIIVDMYTKKEMSYTQIRDYLNTNGIKNSNGSLWSTSTICSMLRKDRLEEYSGIAYWNKENKNVKGVKYNDKSLWVICENAHPSIITKEECQQAIDRKEKVNQNVYKFKPESDYLLSGTNIENFFLFTCSNCGGHVVGCSNGHGHYKKYTCANNRHKGNSGCSNNWKVEKDWIEDKIYQLIKENYIAPKNIKYTIEKIYSQINSINSINTQNIKKIQNSIAKIDKEIQNLLNSIKSGINPELVVNEINSLKEQKDLELENIKKLEKQIDNQPKISIEKIEEYFINLQKTFYQATINEKRELLKTFISNISLNNNEHQVEVSLFPQWCTIVEQVVGIEPT